MKDFLKWIEKKFRVEKFSHKKSALNLTTYTNKQMQIGT